MTTLSSHQSGGESSFHENVVNSHASLSAARAPLPSNQSLCRHLHQNIIIFIFIFSFWVIFLSQKMLTPFENAIVATGAEIGNASIKGLCRG